jgi:hypothetical protein
MDSGSNRHLIRDHPLLHGGTTKAWSFGSSSITVNRNRGLSYGAETVSKPSRKQVPKGRLNFRAVQISGLVDSVALILLDELQLQPGVAKAGWGSAER